MLKEWEGNKEKYLIKLKRKTQNSHKILEVGSHHI